MVLLSIKDRPLHSISDVSPRVRGYILSVRGNLPRGYTRLLYKAAARVVFIMRRHTCRIQGYLPPFKRHFLSKDTAPVMYGDALLLQGSPSNIFRKCILNVGAREFQ